ncbi:MAG TPA: AAA family ATPase [Brevefilum sp.]
MKIGNIIFLNGTSSSGKTTLLRGLQERLAPPYLEMGLDKFIWMLPKRYLDQPLWNDVLGKADNAGPVGHQLVFAMHRSILAAAKAGFNILADHVLVEPDWVRDCAYIFHDFNAYLIGVKCELAVLEKREQERKDRTWGQARLQYEKVHAHGVYDFEVDSGGSSLVENVTQIENFLNKNIPPRAFNRIYQSHHRQS